MRIQRVMRVDGVKGKYVPGVGATHCSAVPASAPPRWSLPPPCTSGIRKYLTRIFH